MMKRKTNNDSNVSQATYTNYRTVRKSEGASYILIAHIILPSQAKSNEFVSVQNTSAFGDLRVECDWVYVSNKCVNRFLDHYDQDSLIKDE